MNNVIRCRMLVIVIFGVFMTFSMLIYVTTVADLCAKRTSAVLCLDKTQVLTSDSIKYRFYRRSNLTYTESLNQIMYIPASSNFRTLTVNLTFQNFNSTTPKHRENSTVSKNELVTDYFYISSSISIFSNKFNLSKDNNIYYERQRNLQRVCNKRYNLTSILKVKKIKLDHILIDEKHKILFCYVPKVACTNWKRVFMILTGKAENISQVINLPSYEIHTRNLFTSLQNYTMSEANKILKDYTKFIFVRNPFERLLSAYRNKLEQHYDSSKYFQARFGKYIIKNFRKNPSNVSLEKGDDVTFSEFVKYLISSDINTYNEHWQTVTELCHPCYINYDLIGKYETLTRDSNFVLNYFKLNFSFPVLTKPSRTASDLIKYFNTLDKDVIYKLYKVYEMDFKLFGYDLFSTLNWSRE